MVWIVEIDLGFRVIDIEIRMKGRMGEMGVMMRVAAGGTIGGFVVIIVDCVVCS